MNHPLQYVFDIALLCIALTRGAPRRLYHIEVQLVLYSAGYTTLVASYHRCHYILNIELHHEEKLSNVFYVPEGRSPEVHNITIVHEGEARVYYCIVYNEAKPSCIQFITNFSEWCNARYYASTKSKNTSAKKQ